MYSFLKIYTISFPQSTVKHNDSFFYGLDFLPEIHM